MVAAVVAAAAVHGAAQATGGVVRELPMALALALVALHRWVETGELELWGTAKAARLQRYGLARLTRPGESAEYALLRAGPARVQVIGLEAPPRADAPLAPPELEGELLPVEPLAAPPQGGLIGGAPPDDVLLEVDGGVNLDTIERAVKAGADVLVAPGAGGKLRVDAHGEMLGDQVGAGADL